jgi:hypothetical protein
VLVVVENKDYGLKWREAPKIKHCCIQTLISITLACFEANDEI